MSGVIEIEGQGKPAIHPQLGEVKLALGALGRRNMTDFPSVAWLTSRIEVPKCLMNTKLRFTDQNNGAIVREIDLAHDMSNAIAMNRIALGFPIDDVQFVKWPVGYESAEGRELNSTAREYGDNPDDWYVSESSIDVLKACELWLSRSKFKPKLERNDDYFDKVRQMVALCRAIPTYPAVVAGSRRRQKAEWKKSALGFPWLIFEVRPWLTLWTFAPKSRTCPGGRQR